MFYTKRIVPRLNRFYNGRFKIPQISKHFSDILFGETVTPKDCCLSVEVLGNLSFSLGRGGGGGEGGELRRLKIKSMGYVRGRPVNGLEVDNVFK